MSPTKPDKTPFPCHILILRTMAVAIFLHARTQEGSREERLAQRKAWVEKLNRESEEQRLIPSDIAVNQLPPPYPIDIRSEDFLSCLHLAAQTEKKFAK